jgi:O-antigen/teichoic acid export membrane protein
VRKGRQLRTNTAMSVLQSVVLGVVPFILYRYLLQAIGAELLGLWSLVLSTTAISRIGELGFSASAVKFVAKYVARGKLSLAGEVVQTAALSVGVIVGLFLLLAYPFAKVILNWAVPADRLGAALSILPFALISLFMTVVAGVFQSGLDGNQRVDLRCAVMMSGSVLHLLLCFILTPRYGILGPAYAQMIQSGTVLLVSWVLLKRVLAGLPWVPFRWNIALFREMFGYGINFQVTSLVSLLYEPTTMSLLGRFGGLNVVAYYRMASKLVTQARSIIVSANRVLVPVIAELQERKPQQVRIVYVESFRVVLYISLPIYASVVMLAPAISMLWIGRQEQSFVLFTILLAAGWFLNTVNAPAFFMNIGLGELGWNTVSHLLIALLNGVGGVLLGYPYRAVGVVFAWAVALALGSQVVSVSYHIEHKVPVSELGLRQGGGVGFACLVSIFASWRIYRSALFVQHVMIAALAVVLLFGTIVAIPLWLHPMRPRLMRWVFAGQ